MKGFIILLAAILILFCGITRSIDPPQVPDEARRHFDRGMAAVEMATTAEHYESAIKEFEQAVRLAPNWSDAHYNLGMVQEKAGKFGEAALSLRSYLRLAPNAGDAEAVGSLINRLEYRQEREGGIRKVYDLLVMKTDQVRWVMISKNGDNEPDWEIQYHHDLEIFSPHVSRTRPIFVLKDGALYKNSYRISPKTSRYLDPEWQDPVWRGDALAIKVNGLLFEYRYSIEMIWVAEYARDRTPVYDHEGGGELSIKAEIVSVDPPRIKREQRVIWPDGQTSVTEFVYELQVDNAKEKDSRTPLDIIVTMAGHNLHEAAADGRIEMAELLIARGKDINARDDEGRTPLLLAAFLSSESKSKKEMAELLIANGADINARDNNGNTPLNLAANGQDKQLAELLITKGADINARDDKGRTPLHIVALFPGMKIVELLIAKGADINARDNNGGTPLQYAESLDRKDVADLLRKHGAK